MVQSNQSNPIQSNPIQSGYAKSSNSLLELLLLKPCLMVSNSLKRVGRFVVGDGVVEGSGFSSFWYDMTYGVINPTCRELYLFSSCDPLTPYEELASLVETRVRSGADVERVEFVGSDHVKHLVMHPRRYEEAVGTFLRKGRKGSEIRMSKL